MVKTPTQKGMSCGPLKIRLTVKMWRKSFRLIMTQVKSLPVSPQLNQSLQFRSKKGNAMSLLWKVPLIVLLVIATLAVINMFILNPNALILVLICLAVLAVPVTIGYLNL